MVGIDGVSVRRGESMSADLRGACARDFGRHGIGAGWLQTCKAGAALHESPGGGAPALYNSGCFAWRWDVAPMLNLQLEVLSAEDGVITASQCVRLTGPQVVASGRSGSHEQIDGRKTGLIGQFPSACGKGPTTWKVSENPNFSPARKAEIWPPSANDRRAPRLAAGNRSSAWISSLP